MTGRPKRLALVTVVLLTLAACGGGETGETTTTAAAGTTTSPSGETTTTQPSDPSAFDWQRFEGETIRVLAAQNFWHIGIEPLIPRFEELTGINVDFESFPEDQARQRIQVELTARSADVDVFMSAVLQDGRRFTRDGWYEHLRPYVEDPELTSPDYDFADIGAGLIEGHTIEGVLIGIPILTDVEMMYYRKDILEQAGVEVPTTMEEFEAVLAAIDDPNGVRAWGSRGRGAAAVTQMSTFLYNFGADWTDDEGNAAFANPEGIAAFEFYGRMLREHGPSGAAGLSWEELMPLFQQKQIAMWNDSSGFVGRIIDPEESLEVENIGFARMPAGPSGENNSFFPWALSMSSLSEKKEASWYFIQWATSPEIVEELQSAGVSGARTSTPFPADMPPEWVEVVHYNLEIARPKLPIVVPVPEVRDIIGGAIVASIEGGDIERIVNQAAEDFNAAVAAAG
jgi:multiple sugar transport system substrate-binding protein